MASVADAVMQPEERFVLESISWDFYLRCCDELAGSRTRISYNEGKLELMVTHSPHEFYKKMLAKLVEMMLFQQRRGVRSGGSLTIRRADLEKGFEPDECWWIEHEPDLRGKSDIDFSVDPAPDLAVEIEISRSLANRVGIYAAIGVPELWRFDGKTLRFCTLQPDGTYVDQETSFNFDGLRPSDLIPYLNFFDQADETQRLHRFVYWLQNSRT
jgi:Uma2 family endonuclease